MRMNKKSEKTYRKFESAGYRHVVLTERKSSWRQLLNAFELLLKEVTGVISG